MPNVAAENLLLACFIRHPQTFYNSISYLGEEDFTYATNKAIFNCLKSLLIDKDTSQVSKLKLIAEAKSLGIENFLSLTKDGKVIDEILSQQVDVKEYNKLFTDVKKEALKKGYLDAFEDLNTYLKDTQDGPSKIIETVEAKTLGQTNLLDRGEHAVVSLVEDLKENIEAYGNNPGNIGISIDMPLWESKIGRIRNKAIQFIASGTKQGKSQIALRAAHKAAHKLRIPTLIVDTELNKTTQQLRLIGQFAQIPYDVIETGLWKLSAEQLRKEGVLEEDIPRFLDYKKRMEDPILWEKVKALPIEYLSAVGLGMEALRPKLQQWVLTKVKPNRETTDPQCLIIYDYIKLATFDELKGGKVAEWQLHGLNLAALHDFVNQYNVAMIALGQTNRELKNNLNCIAGGNRIAENVDSISLVQEKSDEERLLDPQGNYLIRVFASRFGGGTRSGHINIQFDYNCGHVRELGFSNINFFEEKQKRLNEWKKKRDSDDEDDE